MSTAEKLPIAKQLAARPGGFSNGEFAKAAGIVSTAAGAYISLYLSQGHIFRGQPEGQHSRYFHTQQAAAEYKASREKPLARLDGDPVAIARDAVKRMKNTVLSTSALSELMNVAPPAIDAALAPLVAEGMLTRISVQRKGAAEYDYRWSSTWMPKDEHFERCRGATVAPPAASVSPVAPPTPSRLVTTSPVPVPPRPIGARTPQEAAEQGRRGAATKTADNALQRAFSQPAATLGWAAAEAAAPAPAPVAAATPAPTLPPATMAPRPAPNPAPAAPPAESKTEAVDASDVIDVDDLVCAMNDRGELALSIQGGRTVRFKPGRALQLKRFLSNTQVLEQVTGCAA
jgi:hypothetical protein